jgi:hypothetical protein
LSQISFAERPAGGEWQPSIALAAPGSGGRYIDPVVATNEAGEVYVAWGEIKDGNYQLFSAYRSPEQQWESPLVAAVGHTESSDMPLSLAIDARGDAYLTWAESQGGGHTLVRFVATR